MIWKFIARICRILSNFFFNFFILFLHISWFLWVFFGLNWRFYFIFNKLLHACSRLILKISFYFFNDFFLCFDIIFTCIMLHLLFNVFRDKTILKIFKKIVLVYSIKYSIIKFIILFRDVSIDVKCFSILIELLTHCNFSI